MSQCQGVNIYASGDYLVDERQGYLCTTIERLRAHMVTLKEKLQEEKMLLSELKAETHYLTMQQTDNIHVPEDYHPSTRQSKRSVSQSSLSPTYNMTYTGDIPKPEKSIDEPKKKFNKIEYAHRLREIDSLCKEEMARMNAVVEQMEPLKQIASDWMLETRLSEVSGAPASKANPLLELGTAQPYHTLPGIEPAFKGEVTVIPSTRPTSPTPVFMPEGKCDAQPGPPVLIKAPPPIKLSKSKLELKSKKEQDLKRDCLLNPTPKNNSVSATSRKTSLKKEKKETNPKHSSSEVSLSSLEALKEKNITLIEATDNREKRNAKQLKKKAEEDWKSTVSGKTSKSAISLESIQRAFENHLKKKRKADKSGTSGRDALNVLHITQKERENISPDQNNGEKERRKQDKLFAYLHPSAKKIVKNWVMVGRGEKTMRDSSKRKPERSKKCTLNLGRNKDTELSLCEDDVINKFLYDEEGYVYTPLFVSETDEECSSDTNSASQS